MSYYIETKYKPDYPFRSVEEKWHEDRMFVIALAWQSMKRKS